MKMKLVKFKDGKYGVKKWSWSFFKYVYWYFSKTRQSGWWSSIDEHSDSWHADKEIAMDRLKLPENLSNHAIIDYGEVVRVQGQGWRFVPFRPSKD